jgi:MoaA/NifB/PqqE/SkfB family radical SAM enzyme
MTDALAFELAVLKVMDKNLYRSLWLNYLRTGQFPNLKCHALSSYLLLNCDGTIRPCLSLWDNNAGNVLEDDPLKVWFSEEASNIRSKVASCSGCLNKWAVDWNLTMSYPKYLVRKAAVRLSS